MPLAASWCAVGEPKRDSAVAVGMHDRPRFAVRDHQLCLLLLRQIAKKRARLAITERRGLYALSPCRICRKPCLQEAVPAESRARRKLSLQEAVPA